MGKEAAIAAYRQSAYQKLEYDIEASIGKATFPILGGIVAETKIVFNRLLLPVKMLTAYVFGGTYSVDKTKPVAIPPDIAETKYGQALSKLRKNGREVADMRAQSWHSFLSFDFTTGFRMRRAANYTAYQNKHVVLPDEGMGTIDVVAAIGAAKLTRDAMMRRFEKKTESMKEKAAFIKDEKDLGQLSSFSAVTDKPVSATLLTKLGGYLSNR